MKKVICVKNSFDKKCVTYDTYLTIGKIYEIKEVEDFGHFMTTNIFFRIVDDSGDLNYYSEIFFITVEEHRQQKLEKLGI